MPPDNDYPLSWSTSEPYYSPECMPPHCPNSVAPGGNTQKSGASGYFSCVSQDPEERTNCTGTGVGPGGCGGYTLCAANTSKDESRFDFQLEDQRIRDSALGHLELAAERLASADKDVEGSKGFFIGAGFHKPHVPFVFPAEFLQYFPEDLADIPLAEDTYAPIGMPDAAWHFPADVHGFPIKFNGTCNETRSRNFRRGYYAAVSYTVSSARSLLRLAQLITACLSGFQHREAAGQARGAQAHRVDGCRHLRRP